MKFRADSKNVGPESLRPREVLQNGDLLQRRRAPARFLHLAAPGSQKGSRTSSPPFHIIEGMGNKVGALPLLGRERKWVKKHAKLSMSDGGWGVFNFGFSPRALTSCIRGQLNLCHRPAAHWPYNNQRSVQRGSTGQSNMCQRPPALRTGRTCVRDHGY